MVSSNYLSTQKLAILLMFLVGFKQVMWKTHEFLHKLEMQNTLEYDANYSKNQGWQTSNKRELKNEQDNKS
jgi:hypothetical protein